MKRWWTLIAARVDAMSLRERVFLFITLIVLLMLLANVLWLAPVQEQYQQLTRRIATQDAELQRLREELKGSNAAGGPAQALREALTQTIQRLAEVNQEIEQMPLTRPDDTPLPKVLVYFLRRHEGLSLVRTATLSPDNRAAQPTAPGVTRQGLELTVAGPYPELQRYVQTLERALPALRWGTMKLNSEQQPAELTLQVWLLGSTP